MIQEAKEWYGVEPVITVGTWSLITAGETLGPSIDYKLLSEPTQEAGKPRP